MWLGVIDEPLQMLQTDFAVYVGIVYSYLPFMILPLYTNLEKLDLTLLEAAADLGCRPGRPSSRSPCRCPCRASSPAAMLVFIPAIGEFVIPSLLGGPGTLMIGRVLWDEFFNNRDWPVASAVAIAMLLFLVIPIMSDQRAQDAEAGGGRTDDAGPLAGSGRSRSRSASPSSTSRSSRWWCSRSTQSKLVTVWSGFSTQVVRRAAATTSRCWTPRWLSLQIARCRATHRGRPRHAGGPGAGALRPLPRPDAARPALTTAPLVMPEVITGLSLLLLFVAMEQLIGWPAGPRHDDHHHRPRHLLAWPT